MFLEIKGQPLVALQLGQCYLLGIQIPGTDRETKNYIILEKEKDINQRHCLIEINHKEEVFVFDLCSSNGTLLNNKQLNSLEKTRLNNGDVLKLGKQEIKFLRSRHEMSDDSSGFLEGNRNTSDIVSSPDCTSLPKSQSERKSYNNFLVPFIAKKNAEDYNKSSVRPDTDSLNATSNTLSINNRRSDSFTIPETQYCKPRNSINASDLSIAEKIQDDNVDKIKFNFANLDSLDDEICIPETQEVLPVSSIGSSQKRGLYSEVQKIEENSSMKEECSKLENSNCIESSQFRICTQDYNEGFGEEESGVGIHSQIIPFIKHQMVVINNTKSCSNELNKEEKNEDISETQCSKSKVDRNTTELAADRSTPDIFDIEHIEMENKKQHVNKNTKNSFNKIITELETNLQDEDEEDFLPTQVFHPPFTKAIEEKSVKKQENPCLEKENEDFLSLSDKENRSPVGMKPITDLPPTQLFEAKSHTSLSCNISSTIKPHTTTKVQKNSSNNFLNVDQDEEDDLLTQDFLQPPNNLISSSSKNFPTKCLSSTLLDDKVGSKNSDKLLDEIEKAPSNKTSSAAFLKTPDSFSALNKLSATCDTDIDLLMCTPQLIKDNIIVEKFEALKKNVSATKNKNLFSDGSDEEDDNEQSDLVKLINIPKDSLDFDKLLPHSMNRRPEQSKISEKQKAAKEAQKIYKFSIFLGKEHDEKQSRNSVYQSGSFNRDERHALRDKAKEIKKRTGLTKTKDKRSHSNNMDSEAPERKDKDISERKARTKTKEKSNNNGINHDKKIKQAKPTATQEEVEVKTSNIHEKTKRLRKKQSSDKIEKAKESTSNDKTQEIPTIRVTRSKSKYEENPSTSKQSLLSNKSEIRQNNKDDLDNIATQPILRVTRSRSSSKKNKTQDSDQSNIPSIKIVTDNEDHNNDISLHSNVSVNNKITPNNAVERKRKAETLPSKVEERKRLRCMQSSISSSSRAVSIAVTMVDQEMFMSLVRNSKGFWNIAKNPMDCDLLVMDKAYRTFKFLLAMARGVPIVTSEYLKKLNESQSPKAVRISDYLFSDAEFERKFKFSLVDSLQAAKKCKLFKDYEFLLTTNILPNPQEIKALIEASGGLVHNKNPPQPKDNQKLYLVTAKEDKKEWHKYRRINKNIIIVSTEAIMSAVVRQNCECMANYVCLNMSVV